MWNSYLRNVRVLIADDQDFIRSLLRHILGVLGCTHITDVPDGNSAWEIIQDNPSPVKNQDAFDLPIVSADLK